MSEHVPGVFAGDPAAAPTVPGTGGCCANPSRATLDLPDPAAAAGPCCGTTVEAQADDACCGTDARSDAVAAGASCCG
jgi:hypothetical protein